LDCIVYIKFINKTHLHANKQSFSDYNHPVAVSVIYNYIGRLALGKRVETSHFSQGMYIMKL